MIDARDGSPARPHWTTSGRGPDPNGVRVNDLAVAEAAHKAAESRLTSYSRAAGVAIRRGVGWLAVRTGAASNDLNGVVSEDGSEISPEVVHDLIAWFGSVPASWLVRRPVPQLTRRLIKAGARPERSGRWSGLLMPATLPEYQIPVEIVRVSSAGALDIWLDLAAGCGWISDDQDRQAQRRLYQALGWEGALTHWLALDGDDPVGFASSYSHGQVLDLCNLGVLADRRRQGIGRAMVAKRIAAAAHHKISLVVSAPSPEGWRLQQTLGFVSVPVMPDRCFYLPTR